MMKGGVTPAALADDIRRAVLPGAHGFLLATLAVLAGPGLRGNENNGADEPGQLSLEALLDLNGEKIFGGPTKVKGDRMHVRFGTPANFAKGFSGQGLESPTALKGGERRLLTRAQGGEILWPVAVGRGSGAWESRFEFLDDFTIDFKITVPTIARGAQLNLFVNKTRKSVIRTSFFSTATLVENGQTKSRVQSSNRKFTGQPDRWFPRATTEIPVSISYCSGTFTLKFDKSSVITIEGADKVSRGTFGLQYRNVAFVISDLRVSERLNRKWCEEQLEQLEKKGTLRIEDEAAVAARKKRANDPDAKRQRLKEQEAGIEL